MLEVIEKAIEQNIPVQITSKNGKTYLFHIHTNIDGKLIGTYESGKEGSIYFNNIVSCHLSYIPLEIYYLNIVKKNQTEQTPEIGYEIYESFLNNIDKNSLLYAYIHHKKPQNKMLPEAPFLLMTSSNQSQKRAIKDALENPVTIIEGPPGTGKTTTILSLITNFVLRNQNVVVVSKNNSAIDNIKEEFDEKDLPPFYIRIGKKELVKKMTLPNLEEMMKQWKQKNKQFRETNDELNIVLEKIETLEHQIDTIIQDQNQLYELQNKKRHVLKKIEAYAEKLPTVLEKRNKCVPAFVETYLYFLLYREETEPLKSYETWILHFFYHTRQESRKFWSILLMWDMELRTLDSKINLLSHKVHSTHLEQLQNELKKLYEKDYNYISKQIFLNKLDEYTSTSSFEITYKTILDNLHEYYDAEVEKQDSIRKQCVEGILKLYPVILTTVDAFLYNYKDTILNQEKIDVIIIDEASQCDIVSALPLLALAKKIVVVGDCKQLGAIVTLKKKDIGGVEEEYDYLKQNFLSSMKAVFKVEAHLLKEHYRCDYTIINYCNKFFYNNKLIIYTSASTDSMGIMVTDQYKGAEKLERGFQNKREQKSIEEIVQDINSTFIITPFKGQAESFQSHYDKEHCGTIHTFQGRGANEVYMSAVLSDLKECESHLMGAYNLFQPELINVAVSRAKHKFVLACDPTIFKKHNKYMKNLINYIETYGQKIPDKTVCIFDGLYRKIKKWNKNSLDRSCDNIYEYELKIAIQEFITTYPHIDLQLHYPVANLVTDPVFLKNNPMSREYFLRGANVDYCFYDLRLNNPILAIELDGKDHKLESQKEKDRMKEEAIKYMDIPFWRIGSKDAITKKEIFDRLERQLDNSL